MKSTRAKVNNRKKDGNMSDRGTSLYYRSRQAIDALANNGGPLYKRLRPALIVINPLLRETLRNAAPSVTLSLTSLRELLDRKKTELKGNPQFATLKNVNTIDLVTEVMTTAEKKLAAALLTDLFEEVVRSEGRHSER